MIQHLTLSERISIWTNELDKILNHVLGYLLAFTGLIAVADVIGNQRMSSTAPVLFWAWVLIQGLGIDFQILTLIRRLPKLWINPPVFWANIAFIALLFGMLVVVGSVFVEHDTTTTSSIEAAMKALGFPHWLFVWLRSILSALLIVIFGIDRALEAVEHEQRRASQLQITLPPNVVTKEYLGETLTHLRTELLSEKRSDVRGNGEPNTTTGTLLDSGPNTFNMTEMDKSGLRERITTVRIAPAHLSPLHQNKHLALLFLERTPESRFIPLPQQQTRFHPQKRSLKAEQVYRFLKKKPTATLEEIERAAGVKRSYASELRTKLLPEIEAEWKNDTGRSSAESETDH